jgi:hypothetical protein
MDSLRCFAMLLMTLSMVDSLLVKKSEGTFEIRDKFNGMEDIFPSSSNSTEQLSVVADRTVESSNIDELITDVQIQLVLSSLRNQSVASHRSRRSMLKVPFAKWSPVQYYSSHAQKFLEIGQNGLRLRNGHDCSECDLEIAPFCQLFPHVLACPKTVNHLWIYDLVVIRSVKTKTFMCMDIEGKLRIQVSQLICF